MKRFARLLMLSALFGGLLYAQPRPGQTEIVYVKSPDGVFRLFDELGYTMKTWRAGIRVVPRIYLSAIPKRWQQNAQKMPVIKKKELFFRLLAPAVLQANAQVLHERQQLEAMAEKTKLSRYDRAWVEALGEKYAVPQGAKGDDRALIAALLPRVDAVPVSLALAQAADESGWGTSRFAVLGNALFGQWDFSDHGMAAEEHRAKLGTYTVAKFETPQNAVNAYLLNLNTGAAYAGFRKMRAQMRAEGKPLSGYELAGTLSRYSERGEAYVDNIRALIGNNNLRSADTAYLWDKGDILLLPAASK